MSLKTPLSKKFSLVFVVVALFVTALLPIPQVMAAAPLAAIPINLPYSQNFNTLAASGNSNPWSNDSTIAGWYVAGASTYNASDGNANSDNMYSFGTGAASDRALGSISAGTVYFAVRLVNPAGSGVVVNSLEVTYTGEQWRRSGNGSDALVFAYQTGTNLTNPTAGSWTSVSSLNFSAPQTGSGGSPALDGNATANRTVRSAVVTVNLQPGQEVMLRWQDTNGAVQHGMGIDDLLVAPATSPLAAALASFDASQLGNEIIVTWETVSELENIGFNLYRGVTPDAPNVQLNAALIASQAPGSGQGFVYTWEDTFDLAGGTTYYYWLEDVDTAGLTTRHGPISITFEAPTAVRLGSFGAGAPTFMPALLLIAGGLAVIAIARLAWARRVF